MTNHNGRTPDEPAIAEFKTGLRGALIRPGDDGYDAVRKTRNAMIDRRPDYLGEEGDERVRSAYSPATYARLSAFKKKYDEASLFRLSQNIKPAP